MTFAEFLLARIAEDEAEAEVNGWRLGDWDAALPARVLAECEAKRRIIELHDGEHECSSLDHTGEIDRYRYILDSEGCTTMLLLASVYADHADFDPAWRVAD